MKSITFFLLFLSDALMAQLSGNWEGQMTYNQQVFSTVLSLKVVGKQVSGQLTLSINGEKQVSVVEGEINDYSANKSAHGKITDSQNNTTTFLCGLVGTSLNMAIALDPPYGGHITGELRRTNIASVQTPSKASKANDKLPRDPNLIGVWSKFSPYNRNSMNTEEYWAFNADGTMEGKSRSSAIIYEPNLEANSIGDWTENADLKAEREAGIRWFTRNNQLLYKMPDGTEKILVYYIIEQYDGKITLFLRANPNQAKAGAYFRKVN